MQATLFIQKVKVCLQMPWLDPAQQPGPGVGAQDQGYGKALDLLFAVLMPVDAFCTTGFRP